MPRKQTSEKEVVITGHSAAASARRKSATPRKIRAVDAPEPALAVTEEAVATVAGEPSHDEIASLAYALWEARGCQGGSSEADWLAAEAQLRTRN